MFTMARVEHWTTRNFLYLLFEIYNAQNFFALFCLIFVIFFIHFWLFASRYKVQWINRELSV